MSEMGRPRSYPGGVVEIDQLDSSLPKGHGDTGGCHSDSMFRNIHGDGIFTKNDGRKNRRSRERRDEKKSRLLKKNSETNSSHNRPPKSGRGFKN